MYHWDVLFQIIRNAIDIKKIYFIGRWFEEGKEKENLSFILIAPKINFYFVFHLQKLDFDRLYKCLQKY